MAGKVQTVLGAVSPGVLGVVLPHEQPLVDLTPLLKKPEYGSDCLEDLQFKMENLGKIRQYPYSVHTNLLLDDVDLIMEELLLYKLAGGGTLCDISPASVRLHRDDLPRISRETGLHIVAGTAFYVDSLQTDKEREMSTREKADFMVREIVEGVGGSGVRCGVIGEVGCSWPLTESEKRSLQAAAIAQKETGAPIMIHPGSDPAAPFEILDILKASGGDITHTVMGHLDRTIFSDRTTLELAERGCLLEYDLFGIEVSHYQLSPRGSSKNIDFPSDAQRIQKVKLLVDAGHTHQILLSQDIHTKHRLVRYGGHGYAHILEYVVPKMADRGISRDTAMEILTTNPKNWLTFQ